MEAFLRYVIGNLIDHPDEMELTCSQTPRKATFRLRLPEGEVGKIIGRQGRSIAAIRNLLAAGAAKKGKRAVLQIEE
ncbi:MAG TPA: KH domain-containing protein [Chthoniobacteraceae bacterium]|nr:KH domain-containing protein [Chthoniobacteraceae bacterium]